MDEHETRAFLARAHEQNRAALDRLGEGPTPTLLDWLRWQIETRKALAEVASPGPWTANAEHDEVLAVDGERVADGFALSGNQLRATVDHMVFNDPRQIIADCEAGLALLEPHATFDFPYNPDDGPGDYSWTARCDGCGEAAPCFTVRLLASGYRHRPGYLPEWAPEGTTP